MSVECTSDDNCTYICIIMLCLMKTCHLKLSIRTKVLSPEETKAISAAVQLASPYAVAETVMKMSSLRNAIKNVFLREVDNQCSNLCARKSAQPSVLRVPSEHHKSLVEFQWHNILTEMKERAPDVLDFMVAMAVPQLKGSDGRQIMPLCTAYGILMNVRCRELSLIQKMNAVLLGVGSATKRVRQYLISFHSYILDIHYVFILFLKSNSIRTFNIVTFI